MRNLIIAALVAVCVAFQGEVRADAMSEETIVSYQLQTKRIDPSILDRIIQETASATSYSYVEISVMLLLGQATVSAEGSRTYTVVINEADGGNTIISIIDDF